MAIIVTDEVITTWNAAGRFSGVYAPVACLTLASCRGNPTSGSTDPSIETVDLVVNTAQECLSGDDSDLTWNTEVERRTIWAVFKATDSVEDVDTALTQSSNEGVSNGEGITAFGNVVNLAVANASNSSVTSSKCLRNFIVLNNTLGDTSNNRWCGIQFCFKSVGSSNTRTNNQRFSSNEVCLTSLAITNLTGDKTRSDNEGISGLKRIADLTSYNTLRISFNYRRTSLKGSKLRNDRTLCQTSNTRLLRVKGSVAFKFYITLSNASYKRWGSDKSITCVVVDRTLCHTSDEVLDSRSQRSVGADLTFSNTAYFVELSRA